MNPTVNGVAADRPNHHTVVAIVEDKPGVLMRVSSLFRRRGFNIESLTVGHTEAAGLSRMTIVVDGDKRARSSRSRSSSTSSSTSSRSATFRHEDMVARELALIKVRCNNVNRHELLDIANVFRADVVDIATNSIILQVVGDEDKIDGLVKMCEPYGIRELSRTGRIAMVRGDEDHHGPRPRAGADSPVPREPGPPRRGRASVQQRLARVCGGPEALRASTAVVCDAAWP